jgi:uncharacterized protein (TIGR00251 family)
MANKKKSPPHITETDIRVKLIPRSSKNQIVGREGELIKIKVTAPPVGGQANKALIELLAKKLNKPKSHIRITAGESSRLKTVNIKDCSLKDIEKDLISKH